MINMNLKFIHRVIGVVLFLVLGTISVSAQSHVVHGIVHTLDSIPLADAQIFVKGTKQTYFTDFEGNFVVVCNPKDKLTITANGFQKRNVKIDEKTKIVAVNLAIKPGAKSSNYDIGYGHIDEKNRTTSTSTMPKNEASFSRYTSIFEMIKGQFAGVDVVGEEIIIRGTNSLNMSSGALIVLDGVIVDNDVLRTVRPVEVKNISVIKDGTAAVYGSRGTNGVILIETNKGGDNVQ